MLARASTKTFISGTHIR